MGKRCAEVAGFNVHANVRVGSNARDGLEHLCRYLARPPIANDRLQELPDGRLALRFKQPWRDGDGRGEAAWGTSPEGAARKSGSRRTS